MTAVDKNKKREMDGANESITKEGAESAMFDSLLAQASNGDDKASMAF